jgi:hypothetical protein
MNMDALIGRRVRVTAQHREGTLVAATKNGWYSVEYPDGSIGKTRGRASFVLVDETPPRRPSPVSPRTPQPAEESPTDMYAKGSKLTRSQAAALRRCALVQLLQGTADLPKVRLDNLRVVVASRSETLTYETLGAPGETSELPDSELETLVEESAHFAKAWGYVTARDSSRMHGANQRTPHVIYLAVMDDQAYVGLAKNGILDRWAGYKYNHVQAANAVERRGDKTMLVDCALRLHSGLKDKVTWLFVVQKNDDLPLRDEEKRLIHMFGTHGARGMNATT